MVDSAIHAKNLLDTLSISGYVAAGVSRVIEKRGNGDSVLLKTDVEELQLIVDALECQQKIGRQQIQKISEQHYLLSSYDKKARADRLKEEETPTRSNEPLFIRKLKDFKRACKNGMKNAAKENISPSPLPSINEKEAARRSERQINKISPEKATSADVKKEYNGQPPFPYTGWTKSLLIHAIQKLEEGGEHYKVISKRTFMENVVKAGKSTYKSRQGISAMYNTWLCSEDGKVPGGVGRPTTIDIDKVESIVKSVGKERSSDSNRIKLEHVTDALNKDKLAQAAKDGLDPNSVDCKTSKRRVKEAMTAVAMGGAVSGIGMSKKKLANKTEARFRAEHSIMGGYAYAMTVLSTHFVEGNHPHTLSKYNPANLSDNAKQTVEWVKEAFGVDEIHPVDPNLVLSTDDTTLFVFEGTSNDGCNDDWEWKLVDKTEAGSSVHSDFQVSSNAEMGGGLRVRLTFTFTASGMSASPYVAVSGLTADELSPELCKHGLLEAKIPGLCKGGNDLWNEGFGWLVFLRADRKNNKRDQEETVLSIANKKFIHYNDHVLLPFIRSIREKLGWIFDPDSDVPIPDYLKAVSWFDGDIGQLQTMIDEARQALDEAEKICRNKHSAASTGRQQPADLSPVFKLLKAFQLKNTAKHSVACGLAQTIDDYFTNYLRVRGLNLDGNPRKKKALIDFLLCLPEMMERCLQPKHITRGFFEAGMIDETGHVPVFHNLMGTCIRWGSTNKEDGIQLITKNHCMEQFQALMKIQMEKGQISYADMAAHGIPADIDSNGKELDFVRPSGANNEHKQPAKTINAGWQVDQRRSKQMMNLSAKHAKAVADRDVINLILQRNIYVEQELLDQREEIKTLADVTISDLLKLKGNKTEKLKAFIHARKFKTREFEASKLSGGGGKLNVTLYPKQTASSIESNCSEAAPCLVWWAWECRAKEIILSPTAIPVIDVPNVMPQFTVTSAGPSKKRLPSEYLSDAAWLESLGAAVKGVNMITVTEQMKSTANYLCYVLDGRLNLHIASRRVDQSKKNHWTLRLFTRENLPAMAAALCIFGHVVDDDLTTYGMDECLLCSPIFEDESFCEIDGDEDLGALQGCYLYFYLKKMIWIRSGKTSGDGAKACFRGRGGTHKKNSGSVDEMKEHQFYALYPSKGAEETIGKRKGYFDDLLMYCGMAFDPTDDVSNLCSSGESGSLFVWNEEVMKELKGKGGDLKKVQLDAVSYLWEICYDLLLAKSHNVSVSPGYESLGLRVNRGKRKSRWLLD